MNVNSTRLNGRSRRGLTLIELLLVLIILVGLAGVLVPLFGNVVGLTHGASSAGNIEEVTRALEKNKVMFGGYPNQMDLVQDTAGTIAPFGGTVAATELTTTAVTGRIADALIEAGITEVVQHPIAGSEPDEETQTFFSGTVVTVDEATPTPANVVVLGADAIARLGLDAAGSQYVVLGVGNNNDGVGRSMVGAPVHFLPDGGSNEDIYSRFLAVFRIPAEEGAAILSNVCTVDVHDGEGEVVGLDSHITEFQHTREQ